MHDHLADAGDLDAARAVVHAQVRAGGHLHDQIDARVAVPAEPAAAPVARVFGVEPVSLQRHVQRLQAVAVGRAQRGRDANLAGPLPTPDHQLPRTGIHLQALDRGPIQFDLFAVFAIVLGRKSRGHHHRRPDDRCRRPRRPLRHVCPPFRFRGVAGMNRFAGPIPDDSRKRKVLRGSGAPATEVPAPPGRTPGGASGAPPPWGRGRTRWPRRWNRRSRRCAAGCR